MGQRPPRGARRLRVRHHPLYPPPEAAYRLVPSQPYSSLGRAISRMGRGSPGRLERGQPPIPHLRWWVSPVLRRLPEPRHRARRRTPLGGLPRANRRSPEGRGLERAFRRSGRPMVGRGHTPVATGDGGRRPAEAAAHPFARARPWPSGDLLWPMEKGEEPYFISAGIGRRRGRRNPETSPGTEGLRRAGESRRVLRTALEAVELFYVGVGRRFFGDQRQPISGEE